MKWMSEGAPIVSDHLPVRLHATDSFPRRANCATRGRLAQVLVRLADGAHSGREYLAPGSRCSLFRRLCLAPDAGRSAPAT